MRFFVVDIMLVFLHAGQPYLEGTGRGGSRLHPHGGVYSCVFSTICSAGKRETMYLVMVKACAYLPYVCAFRQSTQVDDSYSHQEPA